MALPAFGQGINRERGRYAAAGSALLDTLSDAGTLEYWAVPYADKAYCGASPCSDGGAVDSVVSLVNTQGVVSANITDGSGSSAVWDDSWAGFGGMPSVRFDVSTRLSILSADWSPDVAQPFWLFIVYDKVSASNNRILFRASVTHSNRHIIQDPTAGEWQVNWDSGTMTGGDATDLGPHLMTLYLNDASSYLRVDGVQIASGTLGTNDLPALSWGWTDIADYGGIAVMTSVTDEQGVECYLGDKFSLTITGC